MRFVTKVSISVLSFMIFQTGSCMSGKALRAAHAAGQSAKLGEPRDVAIRRALDACGNQELQGQRRRQEERARQEAERRRQQEEARAKQEEKKENLNNKASDEESKTESNSNTERESRWSVPKEGTKEFSELLGTNDETTKEGTIWYFIRGLGGYDEVTGPKALQKLASAHGYLEILNNYDRIVSWIELKRLVDERHDETEKVMAVYRAVSRAVEESAEILRVENQLIDALNEGKGLDDFEQIFKDSGRTESKNLQSDMEFIKNILGDGGLNKFDSAHERAQNILAEILGLFRFLYSDERFENLEEDYVIGENWELFRSRLEGIAGKVDEGQRLVQTMFESLNTCRGFVDEFNNSERVQEAVSGVLNRKNSRVKEVSELFMSHAGRLPQINDLMQRFDNIDYKKLTEDAANNLASKQSERAIKSNVIFSEAFSKSIDSEDEILAFNNIWEAVRNSKGGLKQASKRRSKGKAVQLRTLISQNRGLFSKVEFVRSIKKDLMSLRSICDMGNSGVRVMFTVISSLMPASISVDGRDLGVNEESLEVHSKRLFCRDSVDSFRRIEKGSVYNGYESQCAICSLDLTPEEEGKIPVDIRKKLNDDGGVHADNSNLWERIAKSVQKRVFVYEYQKGQISGFYEYGKSYEGLKRVFLEGTHYQQLVKNK